jgi:phosphopantetheine attachment domain protein
MNISIEKLIEVLSSVISDINFDEISYDEDLSVMGMDSMEFVTIVVALEEEFDCEIPDEKLLISELNTVNKIYEVIKELGNLRA